MIRELVLKLLAVVVAGAGGVCALTGQVSDEQYLQFPRLFHLDDYERCLARADGLYCMGIFQLAPDGHNPTFNMLQEYSQDVHNFNRTFVHRGYCVSARCPSSPQLAPAARFARCVARWGNRQRYRVHLHKLDYCTTHEDHVAVKPVVETPHRVFLWALAMIAVLNVVGTYHDLNTDGGNKNKFLRSWSVRENWLHLVGPFPAGDPRLIARLPLEGARVIIMLLEIFLHAGCIQDMLYLQNPQFMEKMSHDPVMMLLQNGSSVIQFFILLSSFLLAQSILRKQDGFRMLPKLLLKRIIRIAPVYLVGVGFAATWWPLLGSGPQWGPLVEAESTKCRNKFWAMAFFAGNFFRDDEICLIQTWFISVDMQLYVLGAVLTLALARVRRRALRVLAALFVLSCALSTLLAYWRQWSPLMTVAGPDGTRSLFSNVESFRLFYTKPWGSLPASLAGLFLAHLQHHLVQNKIQLHEHTTVILACQLCLPLLPLYTIGAGNLFVGARGARAALYAGLERPLVSLLAAPMLFGIANSLGRSADSKKLIAPNGFLHCIFGWRGWYVLARLSLAVLMLHWSVNMTLAAARPTLFRSSILDLSVDFIATSVLTYMLALPLTLMLDLPMQRLFKTLAQ